MRRITGLLLILLSFAFIPVASFAYSSNICTSGSVCTVKEVGPFMQGITEDCGNSGNCTLDDILLVFANTGNFVLGIVGGMVLLMYVIGGFYMLSAAGDPGRVTTGKKYLTISTTGLVIVMVAYLAVNTVVKVVRTPAENEPGTKSVTCTEENDGQSCGQYKICSGGNCVDECSVFVKDGACMPPAEAENNSVQCTIGICANENVCCPTGK